MRWAEKTVLVTGAGGFIGSHLTEALVRRGARVRALIHYNARGLWGHLDDLPGDVSDEVEVVAGDVRDPFLVDRVVAGSDIVFHLAALIGIPYSYVAAQSYVDTNVLGTLHVLEAARRHGTETLIHTSTSETYGTAQYTPMDERHPLQAQSPYAASKVGADKLAESYYHSFGLPIVTLRPFNTFGPRQSTRAIIPTIVSQALFRERIELGSLDPVRDFTYVADTVRGFLCAAETPEDTGTVINLGTGRAVSIARLAETVRALIGRDLEIVSVPERVRPESSEVLELVCDNRKAASCLQWRPEVALEDGLDAVITWARSHADSWRHPGYGI